MKELEQGITAYVNPDNMILCLNCAGSKKDLTPGAYKNHKCSVCGKDVFRVFKKLQKEGRELPRNDDA